MVLPAPPAPARLQPNSLPEGLSGAWLAAELAALIIEESCCAAEFGIGGGGITGGAQLGACARISTSGDEGMLIVEESAQKEEAADRVEWIMGVLTELWRVTL